MDLGRGTVTPQQYIYDFSFPRDGGKPNPHLWTNPPFAKRYGRIVADTLIRRDPRHRARYEANFAAFAGQVDELDRAMTTATASLPPRQRQLLTYHDAYAYFGRHYGWKIIGAIQVSSFEDPTPKEVAGLIAQVRAKGVKAIFGSEVFPSSVLAEIGKEAHVRYVDKLRDDDLPGAPGDRLHSWLGLMRFDFETMVSSLGGDASALRAISVDASADHAGVPAMSDPDVLLALDSVTCAYGAQPVLVDASLSIRAGDFSGIVGPSGSGKTTLLRALLGSVTPTSGSVTRRARRRARLRAAGRDGQLGLPGHRRPGRADGEDPRARPALGVA